MPPRSSSKNGSKSAIILATPSSVYTTLGAQRTNSARKPTSTSADITNLRLPEPHTATAMISSKSGSLSTKGKILNVTKSNVRDLNRVKKLYDSNEPMVILVYRDTCGFCEMMKPAWIAFSPEAITKGVNVVNIDSSVLDEAPYGKSEFLDSLKKSFEGFVPFVMKMNGPNDHDVYNGNRTPEDFAKFALKKKKSRSKSATTSKNNKK